MTEELIDKISQVLFVKKDTLTGSTPLRDIVRDSMDIVELVAVLQSDYHISIPPQSFDSFKTIDDIATYVEQNRTKPKATSGLDSF